MASMQSLEGIPHELLLRVVELLPLASIASLSAVSRSFQHFVRDLSSEHLWQSTSQHPSSGRYRFFGKQDDCFTKYISNARSWKDLQRRHDALRDALRTSEPNARESFVLLDAPPQCLEVDFKKRWAIVGGDIYLVNLDLDTGAELFRWPLLDHYINDDGLTVVDGICCDGTPWIDYHDGLLVDSRRFRNRSGQIDIWRASSEKHGRFEHVDSIDLSHHSDGHVHVLYPDLVVMSQPNLRNAWLYNLMDPGAAPREWLVGAHFARYTTQTASEVIHNLPYAGYEVFSKQTGELLGKLVPRDMSPRTAHVEPVHFTTDLHNHDIDAGASPRDQRACPPDRVRQLRLMPGALPGGFRWPRNKAERERWRGMSVDGPVLAAVCSTGKLLVCTDWRAAASSPRRASELSTIVEFDVFVRKNAFVQVSVHGRRVAFNVNHGTHIVTLPPHGPLDPATAPPVYCVPNGSRAYLDFLCARRPGRQDGIQVPLRLADDCLLTGYTWRDGNGTRGALRILTFAPGEREKEEEEGKKQEKQRAGSRRPLSPPCPVRQ